MKWLLPHLEVIINHSCSFKVAREQEIEDRIDAEKKRKKRKSLNRKNIMDKNIYKVAFECLDRYDFTKYFLNFQGLKV